jgi:ribosomal protein S18 acetylase RimI-like enzyme
MSSSKNAFLLVAENTGAVVGFVGCATNLQRFYLDFVVHSLPAIGPLLPKLLNPSALRKIFETSRYATRGGGALSDAELLAISVLKGSQGGGVATLLFREAVSEFAKRGAREFRIVSGISDTGVFFEKMGCTVQSETSIHDGVRSVVYLYRISG